MLCFKHISRNFRKTNIFGKTFFLPKPIFFQSPKISRHQNTFTKINPCVSHVADEICLFRSELKERSTFVYFRDTFRNLRIFRKQLIRKWFSRKCETKISVSTLVYFTTNRPLPGMWMQRKYKVVTLKRFCCIFLLYVTGTNLFSWKCQENGLLIFWCISYVLYILHIQ